MSRDPSTRKEWQEAVDAAAGARVIADLLMYGLVTGGPKIAVERCDELLERGRKQGITPSRRVGDLAFEMIKAINGRKRHGTDDDRRGGAARTTADD